MVLLVLLGYSLQQKLETNFGGDYSLPELTYLKVQEQKKIIIWFIMSPNQFTVIGI
jgi:hypothetical protein